MDVREKEVLLTINEHKKEPLREVLKKGHTRFGSYLQHGVIPSIPDDEKFQKETGRNS